jgi:hypothetical protein
VSCQEFEKSQGEIQVPSLRKTIIRILNWLF